MNTHSALAIAGSAIDEKLKLFYRVSSIYEVAEGRIVSWWRRTSPIVFVGRITGN